MRLPLPPSDPAFNCSPGGALCKNLRKHDPPSPGIERILMPKRDRLPTAEGQTPAAAAPAAIKLPLFFSGPVNNAPCHRPSSCRTQDRFAHLPGDLFVQDRSHKRNVKHAKIRRGGRDSRPDAWFSSTGTKRTKPLLLGDLPVQNPPQITWDFNLLCQKVQEFFAVFTGLAGKWGKRGEIPLPGLTFRQPGTLSHVSENRMETARPFCAGIPHVPLLATLH